MSRHNFLGAIFFTSGVFLFGLIHLAIATYIPHLAYFEGGKLATVLRSTSAWAPYILSLVLMVGGFVLLLLSWIRK